MWSWAYPDSSAAKLFPIICRQTRPLTKGWVCAHVCLLPHYSKVNNSDKLNVTACHLISLPSRQLQLCIWAWTGSPDLLRTSRHKSLERRVQLVECFFDQRSRAEVFLTVNRKCVSVSLCVPMCMWLCAKKGFSRARSKSACFSSRVNE